MSGCIAGRYSLKKSTILQCSIFIVPKLSTNSKHISLEPKFPSASIFHKLERSYLNTENFNMIQINRFQEVFFVLFKTEQQSHNSW